MYKSKGCGEHTPVKFLKREGVSLEGSEASKHAGKGKHFDAPDVLSYRNSNPHEDPAPRNSKFYTDHGRGK